MVTGCWSYAPRRRALVMWLCGSAFLRLRPLLRPSRAGLRGTRLRRLPGSGDVGCAVVVCCAHPGLAPLRSSCSLRGLAVRRGCAPATPRPRGMPLGFPKATCSGIVILPVCTPLRFGCWCGTSPRFYLSAAKGGACCGPGRKGVPRGRTHAPFGPGRSGAGQAPRNEIPRSEHGERSGDQAWFAAREPRRRSRRRLSPASGAAASRAVLRGRASGGGRSYLS